MRLEWIEDLLAVLKAGSLKQAADARFLSQPAFSRRIRSIEDYVGIGLVDRSKKPIQTREALRDQQSKLEEIAGEIRDLLYELRQSDIPGPEDKHVPENPGPDRVDPRSRSAGFRRRRRRLGAGGRRMQGSGAW